MLNFALGPVMIEKEVLEIGSKQLPYFRTADFSSLTLENEAILNKLIHAPVGSRVIFLTGSGTAAMEAAIMNLFTSQDKILIVNGGSFGSRFKELCDVHELSSEEVKLNFGEELTCEHLAPYEDKGISGLLINAHETSTGVLYNMELVGDFCKRNNVFLVVDAISTFLADPYDMQKYGVNASILSSQKALALPPGVSFLIVDPIAQERIFKNRVRSLYFDLKAYLADGLRGQTPYTPSVSTFIQLNKKLHLIEDRGLNSIVEGVARLAKDFRTKIKGLPLKITTTSLSNALTPLSPVGNLLAKEIVDYLREVDIFVCPNGGQLSNTLFRVGHIGAITEKDNDALIRALVALHN
ncbi:pyridoxal-phosphate-dependent aminotransferase family protein [Paenibacillus sp. GCM10012303]|uniref:pyridoxal-phosphate-dependent aminotransferase family protein n=1 Tax=Paenibacillus sp. GCM10012303 TaxID=3317340 RepID=UPI00360864E1